MSEKKTGLRDGQFNHPAFQFTCWPADSGGSHERPGLILSETGLLRRQGTVALFVATGLCRGRCDPTWPSSMEQSQDAGGGGGGHPLRTSSRPQGGQFSGQHARPSALLLLPKLANSRLGSCSDPAKLQIKSFLSPHELFSKAAQVSSSENPWKTLQLLLLLAIFSSVVIVS